MANLSRRAFVGVILSGPFASAAALQAAVTAAPAEAWQVYVHTISASFEPYHDTRLLTRLIAYPPHAPRDGRAYAGHFFHHPTPASVTAQQAKLTQSLLHCVARERPETDIPQLQGLIAQAFADPAQVTA